MRKIFLFCLLLIGITSCKKDDTIEPNNTAAQTLLDVSYGPHVQQKIDVYLPQGRSVANTKTIVIIHGGGWTGGDKSEMMVFVDSMKKRLPDFAVINLNYRLATNSSINVFPSQEDDVKLALDFYLGKSDEYKVSKKLVLLGASAGGHLALLHGYKNDPNKNVKAVVDFFGPTELQSLWNTGILAQLVLFGAIGKTYEQDPALYYQSSPLNFVTPQSPPTIAIQGGADWIMPPFQTSLLISKLGEKSVVKELVYYDTGGHGDWPLSTYSDAFSKIQAFITANVH